MQALSMSSVTHLFPASVALPLIHFLLAPLISAHPTRPNATSVRPIILHKPPAYRPASGIVGLPSAPLLPFPPPAFAVRRTADDGGALA
eukprot:720718-Pleurochrysis_carterae.AAC.1